MNESAVKADNGGWLVAGHLSLRRLESILHRNISQPEDIDSVGGLISHLVEGEVQAGTTVTWDRLRFEVDAVDEGRVTRVLVSRQPSGN